MEKPFSYYYCAILTLTVIGMLTISALGNGKALKNDGIEAEDTTAVAKAQPAVTDADTEKADIENRIVYDTPTGKKYHYNKNCAGENAFEVYLSDIIDEKYPCRKCVK